MNIKVFQNRKIERDYFYNEGTQNENNITVLTFEVPLGYENFSKRIVFITEDGNFWDYIPENKYEIKNNITKYGTVEAYLWLTKDEQDFRTQKFELNFYDNENADNMTPSEEQVDGFNTLIAELEVKIKELNDLKPELDKALKKIENYDTDLEGIKSDIAKRLTEEDAKEIFYTETEVDEMIKEIQETNEYQSEIIDQFKNEFKQITASGDSIHITDAAELPIDLVPYGEPVQTVIPEELGNTVEGSTVVISDGDVNKEVKANIKGNTYQETTEGYNLLDYADMGTVTGAGITMEYTKDGYIVANGIQTANWVTFWNKEIIDLLEDGETYTIKAEDYKSGLVNTSFYCQVAAYKADGTRVNYFVDKNNATFAVDKSTYVRYVINIQIGASAITLNNDKNRFMLYKGIDDKPVEPYTNGVATPNTNHKQDIEVIDMVNVLDVEQLTKVPTNIVTTFDKKTGWLTIENPRDVESYVNIQVPTKHIIGGKTYKLKIEFADTNRCNVFLQKTSSDYSKVMGANGSVTNTAIDDYMNVLVTPQANQTITVRLSLAEEKIKIEDLPWLPYGHIGLVQRGKNYLNIPDVAETTENGITYSVTNGVFKFNGTSTTGFKIQFKKEFKFKKGTYVHSINKVKNGVYFSLDNLSDNMLGTSPIKVVELTEDTTYSYYQVWINADVTFDNEEYTPMIEDGTVKTDFEPYHEPKTIPINLAGHKLAKVGDIADLLNIGVDGSCKIDKKVNYYKFTGTEAWGVASSIAEGTSRFYTTKADIINQLNGLDNSKIIYSNRFKSLSWGEIYVSDKTTIDAISNYNQAGTTDHRIVIRIDSNIADTAEKLNDFLANNETYSYYVLQNPTTIPLPSIEPIELFEGTNILELITNLDTTMAVTYNYVTPSPSIDRPSEIFTVQGDYETEKVNENFFDKDDEQLETNKGKYHLNGSILGNVDYTYLLIENIKPNTKYTFSGANTIVESSVDNINVVLFDCYNGDTFEDEIIKSNMIEGTITTTANCTKMYVSIPYADKGTFQLVKGNKIPTIYTPHKSTTLPLTIADELLGEIVTLTKEQANALNLDGAGKYRRTDYGRYVFTGDESWIKENTANGFRFALHNLFDSIKPDTTKTKWNALSNCFKAISPEETFLSVEGISYIPSISTANVFYLCAEQFKTVDELNAWLKEKNNNSEPLEIIYPLANPTYTKITDETVLAQLKEYDKQIAFYGVNNINTYLIDDINKAPLKIHATYSKSNKLTIQSLEDRLASLESQVTNLQDNQI